MKKWGISEITAVVGLIITVWFSVQDCRQTSRINSLQHELNSLNYKPVLQVVESKLTSFQERFSLPPIELEKLDTTAAVNISSTLQADVSIELENIGNTNARIIAYAFTDTVSGSAKLRKVFLDKSAPVNFDTMGFYDHMEVQPLGRQKIEFQREIAFVENKSFTFHFIIYYENDLGILYDTYFWARFKKKYLEVDIYHDPETGKPLAIEPVSEFEGYITMIDSRTSNEIYSKKERKSFDKALRWLKKRNK